MDICRACGQSGSASQDEDIVNQLVGIYNKLTGLLLTDVEDPGRMVFCKTCTDDLNHFDEFRKKCLEVYERLKDVKVETWLEDDPMLCEVKMETDEDEKPKVEEHSDEDDSPKKESKVMKETKDKKESKVKKESRVKSQTKQEDTDHEDEDNNDGDGNDSDDDDDFNLLGNEDNDDNDDDSDNVSEKEIELSELKPKKKRVDRRVRIRDRSKNNKKPPLKFLDCPKCPSKFIVEHRLEAHLRVHEGLKPFLCKLCGKSFITYKNLKMHHIQKHTDNKIRIPCGFPGCEQVFATKQGEKNHRLRTHDPNYIMPEQIPFICDICGNSYTTNGGLKRHKYTHEPPENLPYNCTFCPKTYHTKSKLVNHMKRHQGILEFECKYCGMKKASKAEVSQHIKNTHEKLPTDPLPCELCAMMFSSKTSLKRHVDVVHKKIKRFNCSVCGFIFSQKDHLNRHMKSHQRLGQIASVPEADTEADTQPNMATSEDD